jgi:hypothetical protein
MHIAILTLFILAALKWGDWKNWQKYYPTFLFFMVGDLLYQFLLTNKPMWMFHTSTLDKDLLPNHTIIVLAKMVIRYAATIAIFLGNFPKQRVRQVLWILFWVIVYISVESFALTQGLISHHNNWTLMWSVYFDLAIFTILAVHHYRPGIAWVLSFLNVLFLWNAFGLTIDILK